MPPAGKDWRHRPRVLPQPFARPAQAHPTTPRNDVRNNVRSLPYDQLDQGEVDLDYIRTCESDPLALRHALETRAARLRHINPELVRNAMYALLAGPPQTYSHSALEVVHRAVRLPPPLFTDLLDTWGNPWSLGVLVWLDVILVLYRPVSGAPLPRTTSPPTLPTSAAISSAASLRGPGAREGIAETDRRVFGALTATSLAARVLIFIPHAHESVLRGMWVALVWLGLGYVGSKRGIAVDFLLERLAQEWEAREQKRSGRSGSAGQNQDLCSGSGTMPADGWLDRMKEVERRRLEGGLTVAEAWEILVGSATASSQPVTAGEPPSTGIATSPIYSSLPPTPRPAWAQQQQQEPRSPLEPPTYWRPRDRPEEPSTLSFVHLVQPMRRPHMCAEDPAVPRRMDGYQSEPSLMNVDAPHRRGDCW